MTGLKESAVNGGIGHGRERSSGGVVGGVKGEVGDELREDGEWLRLCEEG
jgi:hypothetical protein